MGVVAAVAAAELRVRRRTWAWRAALAVWLAVSLTVAVTVGLIAHARENYDPEKTGLTAFGVVVLLLLAVSVPVAGALAALPAGHLPPASRGAVPGRFAGAWLGALALPAATLPALVVAMAFGGVSAVQAVAALAVVGALLGVAVALALYVVVSAGGTLYPMLVTTLAAIGLCAIPPVAFTALASAEPDPRSGTRWSWLVRPSPLLVLGDAVPRSPGVSAEEFGPNPLGHLGEWGRSRSVPGILSGRDDVDSYDDYGDRPGPVWPAGLAVDATIGATALALAVRRARRPLG